MSSGSKFGSNLASMFYGSGGYGSDADKASGRRRDTLPSSNPVRTGSASGYSAANQRSKFSSLASGYGSAQSAAGRALYGGGPYAGMDAYTRHRQMMMDYSSYARAHASAMEAQTAAAAASQLSDADILAANHRFIRDAAADAAAEAAGTMSWEQRMAKKYYDKLFKEYCLGDLTFYKTGKFGFRWRTQPEVVSGKGQFVCGNKKCSNGEPLRSYEVNFSYTDGATARTVAAAALNTAAAAAAAAAAGGDAPKQALVKIRLCTTCAYKLNYVKIKSLEAENRARIQLETEKQKKAIRTQKRIARKAKKAAESGQKRRKKDTATAAGSRAGDSKSGSDSSSGSDSGSDDDVDAAAAAAESKSGASANADSAATASTKRKRSARAASSAAAASHTDAKLSEEQELSAEVARYQSMLHQFSTRPDDSTTAAGGGGGGSGPPSLEPASPTTPTTPTALASPRGSSSSVSAAPAAASTSPAPQSKSSKSSKSSRRVLPPAPLYHESPASKGKPPVASAVGAPSAGGVAAAADADAEFAAFAAENALFP